MKIASWNVNSIRARSERLFRWLKTHGPDVLCLQETKVDDPRFPADELESAGYHSVFLGQRAYNGVAILSRKEPTEVTRGLDDGLDDTQARIISARIDGVRVATVYVPNGKKVMSKAYDFKLEWLRRLRMWLERECEPSEEMVLCGDFNVIPESRDASKPAMWRGTVMASAEVRQLLEEIARFGFVDTFRQHHEASGHWSWWDYRMRGFERDEGVRIDVLYATESLAARCVASGIDKAERDPSGHESIPSDHAPIWADFDPPPPSA